MNTEEIMKLSVDMAGFESTPVDSEIYVKGENIKKVLFGIDIDTGILFMAKNMGYDAVIAHHPAASITKAFNVYKDQIKNMVKAGVSQEAAEKAVADKVEMLKINSQAANYDHVVSVAKLLNMPFMNIHQPLDELGRKAMQDNIDKTLEKGDASLQDVVDGLYKLGEFQRARTNIEVLMGDPKAPAGKVLVAHGAYTNGGYDLANACFEAGVDTVVYIHIAYPDYVKLKKEAKGNLIVTGHIASDALGINPFVKKLEEKGLQVTSISGLI